MRYKDFANRKLFSNLVTAWNNSSGFFMSIDLSFIAKLFPNYEDYQEVKYEGFENKQSILIALHNGGESMNLHSKMWRSKELNDCEQYFINSLIEVLEMMEPMSNQKIYRYEINTLAHDVNDLQLLFEKCINTRELFENKAFWNFSVSDWNFDEFKIVVETSDKSNARSVYNLFGENGLSEQEIIILPNTKFKVKSLTERLSVLEEI